MKERPILFSADMMHAILAGRKTQTRRVVKDPFDKKGGQFCVEYADNDPNMLVHVHDPKCGGYCNYACHYPCPYGQPGDRLWVRERWAVDMSFDDLPPRMLPVRGMPVFYHASAQNFDYKWRPSIHMPRWASRITLEVTDVRVQRLQEISEEDALAEGVETVGRDPDGAVLYWDYFLDDYAWSAGESFISLWHTLHGFKGPNAGSFNPWVWAVSFKVVMS